ncbi:MAG TPA: LuxR C-terminal-related transcriptional regulator [Candidatus Dormibacteraeota bacterium]|nr:LuxR C-terminal-related transcriptional regulator [Candidatus Dormibacteraeota bacterium]
MEFNTRAICASPVETPPVRLSRREHEIAALVVEGLTNREIATRLFISERTVDGHLEHVREKLGVNTRAQIAAWIVRQDAEPGPTISTPIARPEPRRRLVVHPRLWIATALLLAVLAAAVGVLRLTAPPEPIIETFAGTTCAQANYPGGCLGGDGGFAINAQLARPSSIAIDANGFVYFADFGNNRVRRVTAGTIRTVAGGGSDPLVDGAAIATSVKLGNTSSVAVDSHNQLYVLTSVNQSLEVWMVKPDGFMTRVVQLGRALGAERRSSLPLGGLAVSRDGTLYIADRAGNRVWKFANEKLSPYVGTAELGKSGDGGAAQGARLAWPIGLALDTQNNLYISDTRNNRIRKVDARSEIITTFAGSGQFEGNTGDGGPADHALLSFPFGVAVGADGSVVIADTGNHRLRRVVAGTIYPLAGTGSWGFGGDSGHALQAQLSGPEAVAFDAKGNLFIADTENQRVRKVPRLAPPG